MKKIILLPLMVLLALNCKAQLQQIEDGVVPLENFKSFMESVEEFEDIPVGTYFKDVNHVLDNFVGTWTGEYNGNDYTLVIAKEIGYVNERLDEKLKSDRLIVRHKITDASGNNIENTLDYPEDSQYVMKGSFGSMQGDFYGLFFIGESNECATDGDVLLSLSEEDNDELNVFIIPDSYMFEEGECDDGYYEYPFPDQDETPMTLTKEE